jgi:hypothetical protein
MANTCSNHRVRGCPASFYLSCPAYLNGKNCWEVAEKPCCGDGNLTKCGLCPTFTKGSRLTNT